MFLARILYKWVLNSYYKLFIYKLATRKKKNNDLNRVGYFTNSLTRWRQSAQMIKPNVTQTMIKYKNNHGG